MEGYKESVCRLLMLFFVSGVSCNTTKISKFSAWNVGVPVKASFVPSIQTKGPIARSSQVLAYAASRPKNCEEVQRLQGYRSSGVYRIYPFPIGHDTYNEDGLNVFCDLKTDGGGWTVFQRRVDETDFQRTWVDYRAGFGNLIGSHWLGLDTIAQITRHGEYTLRVELEDWEGVNRTASYGYFRVGGEKEKYKLYIYDYVGNAGQGLFEGQMFSTKDQDNDESVHNCAITFNGAWWYKDCHKSNLNGLYLRGNHSSYANGVNWEPFRGNYYSLKRAEMKIRRRCFNLD